MALYPPLGTAYCKDKHIASTQIVPYNVCWSLHALCDWLFGACAPELITHSRSNSIRWQRTFISSFVNLVRTSLLYRVLSTQNLLCNSLSLFISLRATGHWSYTTAHSVHDLMLLVVPRVKLKHRGDRTLNAGIHYHCLRGWPQLCAFKQVWKLFFFFIGIWELSFSFLSLLFCFFNPYCTLLNDRLCTALGQVLLFLNVL